MRFGFARVHAARSTQLAVGSTATSTLEQHQQQHVRGTLIKQNQNAKGARVGGTGQVGVAPRATSGQSSCAACSILSVLTQWGATLVIKLKGGDGGRGVPASPRDPETPEPDRPRGSLVVVPGAARARAAARTRGVEDVCTHDQAHKRRRLTHTRDSTHRWAIHESRNLNTVTPDIWFV